VLLTKGAIPERITKTVCHLLISHQLYEMATPHHYTTQRTARYYLIGSDKIEAKHFWLTCHGFAQLAGEFINEFEPLVALGGHIVAPEALNRFYTRGFDGRVAATWMTKDDRDAEIQDYVTYLDGLYTQETKALNPTAQKHILGFSQGATTVCRWVALRQPAFDHLWLCSGDLPHDLDWVFFKKAMEGRILHLVLGNADPLLPEGRKESTQAKIEEYDITYEVHEFEGAHEISIATILGHLA
jgi:predicted esterase